MGEVARHAEGSASLLIALKGGGIIARFSPPAAGDAAPPAAPQEAGKRAPNVVAAFFDGRTWHTAANLRDLVRLHYDILCPLLDGTLPAAGGALASNDGRIEADPVEIERIVPGVGGDVWVSDADGVTCFDGKRWHDAGPAIRAARA